MHRLAGYKVPPGGSVVLRGYSGFMGVIGSDWVQ